MQETKRASRRRHDAELKAKVLAECDVPGASVAQVALSNGLNANLVHKWRRLGLDPVRTPRDAASFIPVMLASATRSAAADIRIELRRGPIAINVTWPSAEAAVCAAWMRELLR